MPCTVYGVDVVTCGNINSVNPRIAPGRNFYIPPGFFFPGKGVRYDRPRRPYHQRRKAYVDKLTGFYRPMRLCEIVKALDIDKSHCITLLKNLVAKGIIETIEEFGKPIYTVAPPHQTVAPPCQTVASVPSVSAHLPVQERNSKVKKVKKKREKDQLWTPLLRLLRDDFVDAGLGWRWTLATNKQTWKAEVLLAAKHDFEPRGLLFPSRHTQITCHERNTSSGNGKE